MSIEIGGTPEYRKNLAWFISETAREGGFLVKDICDMFCTDTTGELIKEVLIELEFKVVESGISFQGSPYACTSCGIRVYGNGYVTKHKDPTGVLRVDFEQRYML